MAYREPGRPPIPESPDLRDYEQELRRSARRKKVAFAVVVVGMAVLGLGSCLAPIAVSVGTEAWNGHKTKLKTEEAKEVQDLLGPLEADAKKSQAAFSALWPKLQKAELGPRRDLGACEVDVPGPSISHGETVDEYTQDGRPGTSLRDSVQGEGWTFVDLSHDASHSPLTGLEMPQGSFALNNTPGTKDRYVLPSVPLRTTTVDAAPTLDSARTGLQAAELLAQSQAVRRDEHERFLRRVREFAEGGLPIDVVVFVDLWEDPKFSDAPPPSPRETLHALERGERPTRMFDSGVAIARAFAWSPTKQQLVCAAQALAQSSNDVLFRSGDMAPLRQDLVLQLERSLQRSFVAVGPAPPRLSRPALDGGSTGR